MTIILELTCEEALACAIALDNKRKPIKWQRQALAKIDKALKLGKTE